MKYILFFVLIFMTQCFAAKELPVSIKAKDGKNIYAPAPPLVNVSKEQKLQKDDQNITGMGKAK